MFSIESHRLVLGHELESFTRLGIVNAPVDGHDHEAVRVVDIVYGSTRVKITVKKSQISSLFLYENVPRQFLTANMLSARLYLFGSY